jgi:hypothetical protein
MIGCFVNIRGVEHPNKQRFLRETIREEGACFIGVNETVKIASLPIGIRRWLAIETYPGGMFLLKGDLVEFY